MPVQMIELEEVLMIEASDTALEAAVKAEGVYLYGSQGTLNCPNW